MFFIEFHRKLKYLPNLIFSQAALNFNCQLIESSSFTDIVFKSEPLNCELTGKLIDKCNGVSADMSNKIAESGDVKLYSLEFEVLLLGVAKLLERFVS